MAIENKRTYLVLNFCSNLVSVATRYDSFVLEPCQNGEPTSIPLSIEEIQQINNTSDVFKTGALRFEAEYESEIYDILRIRDWEKILSNEDLEKILRRNNKEDMEMIVSIKEPRYFNRVYGIYIGLKNSGYPFNRNVEYIMSTRYRELSENKITTKISLKGSENNDEQNIKNLKEKYDETRKQNEDMSEELNQMKKVLEQVVSQIDGNPADGEKKASDKVTPPKKAPKPKPDEA